MVNLAKVASNQDGREFLLNGFKGVQERLLMELRHSQATITHDGTMGGVNEAHWIDVFRSYLPRRYACDTGIVIDSEGHTSDQIDIVVYDPQYTPTLLSQQAHRFIPIEAVYAVFEAKPKVNKPLLEYAADKAASVRRLRRTSVPIAHAGGVFKEKPFFPIVAGIVAADCDWTGGLEEPFLNAMKDCQDDRVIDCGCILNAGAFDRFNDQHAIAVRPDDPVLVYFLFRILKKLQSLGTVPAIDWDAYLSAF